MLYQRLLGDGSVGSHEFLPGREEESQELAWIFYRHNDGLE